MKRPEKKEKEQEQEEKLTVKAEIFDWMRSIIFAIIVCVLLFVFVVRVVTVDGNSMNPTLLNGDKLIVSALNSAYEAGDVVVLVAPDFMDEPLVKRIIATEGQFVEINFDKGIVKVDDEILYEPYIAEPINDKQDYDGPIEVPEGCVFVMGDNRNHSTDSRTDTIGCVDTRYILGKAYFVAFPLKSFGFIQTEFANPVASVPKIEKNLKNSGAGRVFQDPKPDASFEPVTSPDPADEEATNE